jgi:hypothetical protein
MNRRTLLALAVLAAAAPALPFSLAAAPADEGPQLVEAVVTDVDPQSVLVAPRGRALQLGWAAQHDDSFHAHETLNLWVVPIFDRRDLGTELFDLRARFVLPDGSTYEQRVLPVDPAGLAAPGQLLRPDIAPHAIDPLRPERMRRLARMTVSRALSSSQARRNASFVQIMLPVSGTWITQHNLYGRWAVELETVVAGEVTSTVRKEFDLVIETAAEPPEERVEPQPVVPERPRGRSMTPGRARPRSLRP